MSFREIIAEVHNLTEDEKRQLLELLERDLYNCANKESPASLAMLKEGDRIDIQVVGHRP